MTGSNLVVRSLHDAGLAAWFGGGLMGAVGLNGAAAKAADPNERLRLSSVGWAKWAPWQAVAMGAHAVGGIGLIVGNRRRLRRQSGATALTVAKLVLTAAAAGTTVWSGALGATIAQHAAKPSRPATEGVTEPASTTDPQLASAQRQLKALQWVTPVLTGAALILGAAHGEQQRGAGGLLDPAAEQARDTLAEGRKAVGRVVAKVA